MSPRAEAEKIMLLYEGHAAQALMFLQGQLNVLHQRAQVLLSLSGVVVSVTGFSGRTIAGTNPTAQWSIVLGLSLVLLSAVWVYARVMAIRWVSLELDRTSIEDSLEAVIRRRNQKTAAYGIGGVILCVGLALYGFAVALMLLYPSVGGLPARVD